MPLFLWTSETNEQLFVENIYGDTHGVLNEQQFSNDDYDHINFKIDGADQGKTMTIIIILWYAFGIGSV